MMSNAIKAVAGIVAIAVVVYFVASDDQKEEIRNRLDQAGQIGVSDKGTPRVVREQRRKERLRQNDTWTTENQARHPIEYCQARLADLDEYVKRLEVVMHRMMVARTTVNREMGDNEARRKDLIQFLADAKKAYRESIAAGGTHVMLGGFRLPLQKARGKMVEANRRIPYLQERTAQRKNMVVKLDKNIELVVAEQRRLVETRERIQNTISDLQLKNVVEGERSVRDALNAINDSMASLGIDYDDPSLVDIVQPLQLMDVDGEFEKLMAE